MDFALSPEQQALFDLTAARQVLRHAAWPFDKDAPEATVSCAMAQRHVSGSASSIADGGLQPHGGRGRIRIQQKECEDRNGVEK